MKTKQYLHIIWLMMALFIASNAWAHQIILGVDQGKYINFPKNAKYIYVDNPNLLKVELIKDKLYITARQKGATNININNNKDETIAKYHILSITSFDTIKSLISSVNSQVNIIMENNVVYIKGTTKHQKDKETIENIVVKEVFPLKVKNHIQVIPPKQIYLQVRVMSMSKSISDAFKPNSLFNYTSGDVFVDLAFFRNQINNVFSGVGASVNTDKFNMEQLLDLLESRGLVSTLSKPNLVTEIGESASFSSGGKFPFVVAQDNNVNTINLKEFGVQLSFLPKYIENSEVYLQINANISDLSANSFNQSVPIIDEKNINTNVHLPFGKSLAIGGLVEHKVEVSKSYHPIFTKIPIVGQLFRKADSGFAESEVIVLITPYIVNPATTSKFKHTQDYITISHQQRGYHVRQ